MKGFRTVTINLLAGALPILEMTEVTDVMPAEWLPWFALGLALANILLRYVTTTPIGRAG